MLLLAVLFTWCCLKGLLQRFFVNMCVICCAERGVGEQGREGTRVREPMGGTRGLVELTRVRVRANTWPQHLQVPHRPPL